MSCAEAPSARIMSAASRVASCASRPQPSSKIGDIARAALVLTHFEHGYIT